MTPSPAWARALRALTLLAIDPEGLRGLTLRARAGPVRQAFDLALTRLPGPGTVYLGQDLEFWRDIATGDRITATVTLMTKESDGRTLIFDTRCIPAQ
jgi:hypothetical protein